MRKCRIVAKENNNKQIAEMLAEKLHISPLAIGVLLNRGITDEKAITEFLYGSKEPFHNPFLLKDMAKAVQRILEAVGKGERITVYGDYDVDGITASSLLFLFLKSQGAKVDAYIPRRADEGYGLNNDALKTLFLQGTRLVITVDSGISGIQEVADMPTAMDIIITDHHMPPEHLPKAFAIINPKQPGDNYPFKELAGVGVAFKLCQGVYQSLSQEQKLWENHLELVALGTIADIVPLVGENRELVRKGLACLTETKNLGLQELLKVAGINNKKITGSTVGFGLAPRLNAVGRLADAMSGVKLLTTTDRKEAVQLAQMLHEENIIRQEISSKIFNEAEAMLEKKATIETAIVLAKEDWHAGVIGIAASRLVDKYNLPVILLTKDGENGKASCRSIPPLNLYDALSGCKEYLLQFGGHSQAAGLTIAYDKIDAFRQAFKAQVRKMLNGVSYEPVVAPDFFVPEDRAITVQTVHDLALLEPCGAANSSPIFAFAQATVSNFYLIGKEKNHLKLVLNHGKNCYKAVAWREGSNIHNYYQGQTGTFAFIPKINEYQGQETVDLQLIARQPLRDIVDLRQKNNDKIDTLKTILQTGEKTVVYLHDISALQALADKPNLILKDYSASLWEPDVLNVVLFDLAGPDIFAPQHFFLAGKTALTLYLLYNQKDLQRKEQLLQQVCPSRASMGMQYKYLRELLARQGVASYKDVVGHLAPDGIICTEEILRVFQELNFITIKDGQISFRSSAKNELSNSPTYCQMRGNYKKQLEPAFKALAISPLELAKIWN